MNKSVFLNFELTKKFFQKQSEKIDLMEKESLNLKAKINEAKIQNFKLEEVYIIKIILLNIIII